MMKELKDITKEEIIHELINYEYRLRKQLRNNENCSDPKNINHHLYENSYHRWRGVVDFCYNIGLETDDLLFWED